MWWKNAAALAALAVLMASCTGSPTQLVVVVDSDLAIPDAIDRVRISVNAGVERMTSEEQALASDALLPLTVGVSPEDDFLGPIDVLAEGMLDGTVVVTRRARVTLVQGQTRMLRLDLLAGCVGVACAADESCTDEGCSDVVIAELPPWTGTPPRVIDASTGGEDAGRFDAGPRLDGGPRDAGPGDAGMPDPCVTDDDCDDGVDCTSDVCMSGLCVGLPDDSQCDDDNDCTDDRCTVTGCATDPNTLPCDDGVFCNGFDRCGGGTCSAHTGDPCGSPTVCDESGRQCTGCQGAEDCPAATVGEWGGCDYSGQCDEAAMRTRTNRVYACTGGSCVPSDTPESEPCTRATAGDSCGVGSCGGFGGCNYTDDCDEAAVRTQTCNDLECAAGVCTSVNRTETMPCSRSTTGDSCGTTSCGGFGGCNYTDNCGEAAVRTQTCTDFECGSGMCQSSQRTETMACSRSTAGDACGTESCGMFGACNYSDACDEMAQQSRTCSTPTCGGGTCSGSSMRTDTTGCTRDTDGMSCGASRLCTDGNCVSCTPTLSGTAGGVGTNYMQEVSGSGNMLRFVDNSGMNSSVNAPAGVTFTGGGTTTICIWRAVASGNQITFYDFSNVNMGSVTVTGATVSGTSAPACSPSPYGCFPPCMDEVVGGAGALTFNYTNGTTGTVTLGCP